MMEMLMRRPQVEQTVGLSRSTLYAAIKNGDFPRPIRIGKRAVAWRSSEVESWLNYRSEVVV
ncbi:AlpA family phage regulatory protein, partial [Escherichia coli]|nr:AlpA family phage regulatory protein [Escherichia coli]